MTGITHNQIIKKSSTKPSTSIFVYSFVPDKFKVVDFVYNCLHTILTPKRINEPYPAVTAQETLVKRHAISSMKPVNRCNALTSI